MDGNRLICVEVGDADLFNQAEIRDALGVVNRSEARLACWKSELLVSLNRLLSDQEAKRVAGQVFAFATSKLPFILIILYSTLAAICGDREQVRRYQFVVHTRAPKLNQTTSNADSMAWATMKLLARQE